MADYNDEIQWHYSMNWHINIKNYYRGKLMSEKYCTFRVRQVRRHRLSIEMLRNWTKVTDMLQLLRNLKLHRRGNFVAE